MVVFIVIIIGGLLAPSSMVYRA